MKFEAHFLQVEDDVGDIFLDARDGGELVQHALDAHGGNRIAGERGEQDPAQCVTDSYPVAALERFGDEAPVGRGRFLFVEFNRLRFDEVTPIILHSCVLLPRKICCQSISFGRQPPNEDLF